MKTSVVLLLGFAVLAFGKISKNELRGYQGSLDWWEKKIVELKLDQRKLNPRFRGTRGPMNRTIADLEDQYRLARRWLRALKKNPNRSELVPKIDLAFHTMSKTMRSITSGQVVN